MSDFNVCLKFGLVYPTLIENDHNYCIENPNQINDFIFPNTEKLCTDEMTKWTKDHLKVVFDGELDDPYYFNSIKAVGFHGPKIGEYTNSGLLLSDINVYIKVNTVFGFINDKMLDDLFHLIVFQINDGYFISFYTMFSEYHGLIIDKIPKDIKEICVYRLTPSPSFLSKHWGGGQCTFFMNLKMIFILYLLKIKMVKIYKKFSALISIYLLFSFSHIFYSIT